MRKPQINRILQIEVAAKLELVANHCFACAGQYKRPFELLRTNL
jgi:hypothetical protein